MKLGSEWKYHITINQDDVEEVRNWCLVNIGEFKKSWYKFEVDLVRWHLDGDHRSTWFFKQETDAIQFVLRWA